MFQNAISRNGINFVLRKYSKIMRIALSERLVYRFDFMLSTFLRFLPMLTTILLWHAIYAGARPDRAIEIAAHQIGQSFGAQALSPVAGPLAPAVQMTIASAAPQADAFKLELAGFHLNEMISYLLLVHISRMFSSMPGLAQGVARDIRDGSLKKYIIQPLDMVSYLVAYRIAHKTAYIMTASIPYAVLFWLCLDYFPGWPAPPVFAAYCAALLMGFLIGFFFECTIGMIGFWFLEVTSFLYVITTLTFFFSGHMFPLDLLGPFWGELLKSLPFQYLAYFPAAIFLGKVEGDALLWGLAKEACWAAGLIVLSRVIYKMGLKRYSAYGG